jgi:FAD/FMN-containing dehydrogenase/Fe-S oxidoreductase
MPHIPTNPPPSLGPSARSSGLQRLSDSLEGQLRTSHHDRLLYATDASLYQVIPRAVVIPKSLDDLLRTAQYCLDTKTPLLPRGAGTSLAGQAVNDCLILDNSVHLNAIESLTPQYRTAIVQPGVILDTLNTHLAPHRLFFAPDVATSSHATIGGMIGNNSAGARSVRYGLTADHVRALDVILFNKNAPHRTTVTADPSQRDPILAELTREVCRIVERVRTPIRQRFPKILRHVDAYALDRILDQLDTTSPDHVDLTPLLVGSEGTLALTLRAHLKLTPTPAATVLVILAFDSLSEALAHVNELLTLNPTAVELLDDMLISLAQRNAVYKHHVDLLPQINSKPPRAVLYVELTADNNRNELDAQLDKLRALLPDTPTQIYRDADATSRAWALRKAGEPLLHNQPGNRIPLTFVEDTAVAPEKLPQFVERFGQICDKHNTTAAFFAHASVGCLHIRPLLDPADANDRQRMVAIAQEVTQLVREYSGALSGEHGDGRARTPLLESFLGTEIMDACRQIKSLFDPHNLLNPGNIVESRPPESITTHLRVLPLHQNTNPCDTSRAFYDYPHDGGPLGAAAQCNGAGFCRRTDAGIMCPSFRALRDERHSTRGRANALRLALSGQLAGAHTPWDDPGTHETLSLCLSCKACAAECPSNVDVATLKSEYLAQSRRAKPWRAIKPYIASNIRLPYMLGSLAPTIATAIAHSRAFRSIIHPLMGFSPDRKIPGFSKSLAAKFRDRKKQPSADSPRVGILVDCTTGFAESAVGMSAVRVLEAFGYAVTLVDVGCCQRPALSAGLLSQSARRIPRTIRKLETAIQQHNLSALLSLEPSCYSAIADDWLRLRLPIDSSRRQWVANHLMLVEDFLDKHWDAHPAHPHMTTPLGHTHLHQHCHQRSILGTASGMNLLERLNPGRVERIDKGCCGMAGTFGYESHTIELSHQIAEQGVLPEVHKAPGSDNIITSGASCRTQIREATGREPLHPVQLVEKLISGKATP